ncbi:MAG: DUF951 domain-containing protein [Clostridia bacterium]|nr:DUF951 domain-containing protein [Clostridia bacterium]
MLTDNSFCVGQRVIMRKPHACGADEWVITRTGADVKIKCTGCGRVVMLDRGAFMKAAKKLLTEVNENEEQ